MSTIKTLCLIAAAIFAAGCASSQTTNSAAPTHYWEAAVPQHTYNRDNQTCKTETGETSSAAFEGDSLSFQKYRDCMIEKGYTLRTY